ncbi:hypothetical protein HZB60_04025, partial [candidate division KSB1 bacterium]|nr:hypothetical protein [candidate division KSB1 bacterium]
MGLPAVVEFKGQELEVLDRDGKPWLASPQIADALGMSKGSEGVGKIYRRHQEEFDSAMTRLIIHPTQTGRDVRIFSPRGCHLIGMFARTERAKAFRKWVLDVLEKLGEGASAAGREQM